MGLRKISYQVLLCAKLAPRSVILQRFCGPDPPAAAKLLITYATCHFVMRIASPKYRVEDPSAQFFGMVRGDGPFSNPHRTAALARGYQRLRKSCGNSSGSLGQLFPLKNLWPPSRFSSPPSKQMVADWSQDNVMISYVKDCRYPRCYLDHRYS